MAYFNNSFPATYQNPYYQQQVIPQQPVVQQQQSIVPQQNSVIQNTGIIWVQGEAGAKSYLVAPNTTVQLWDSESQVIYLKSADASGMPSMKVIDYTIRGAELPNNNLPFDSNKYISREEFDQLEAKLNSLQNEINGLKPHKKEGKHNG